MNKWTASCKLKTAHVIQEKHTFCGEKPIQQQALLEWKIASMLYFVSYIMYLMS